MFLRSQNIDLTHLYSRTVLCLFLDNYSCGILKNGGIFIMTKSDLIAAVATKIGSSKKDSEKAVCFLIICHRFHSILPQNIIIHIIIAL